jgi:pimeloyl-ACP methyl ester carboxylesterase
MHLLLSLLFWILVVLVAFAAFSAFIARKVTQAFPPTGQYLEVDGERIHYRSLGEGPPMVLVHGLAGQMRNFEYLPLADLARRWRIVLVDRPGSGLSPRRDDAKAGLAAQGLLLAHFIRALRLAQPPLLVGHSLGGAVALSTALQDPEAIAGVALIAPLTHYLERGPAKPFRPLAIHAGWLRRLVSLTFAVPMSMLIGRHAVTQVFAPEPAPADFPVRGGGLLGLRPSAFRASSLDLVALERELRPQESRYGELRLPVRILYGEGDEMLDWRVHGEALRAKVPQAQLTVVPGGHMLPVTQAAGTAAWLDEAAQATLR